MVKVRLILSLNMLNVESILNTVNSIGFVRKFTTSSIWRSKDRTTEKLGFTLKYPMNFGAGDSTSSFFAFSKITLTSSCSLTLPFHVLDLTAVCRCLVDPLVTGSKILRGKETSPEEE